MNSRKEGSPPLNPFPENPDAKSMAREDVQLLTFNGNGAEDPKQHWFLYEFFWMVQLGHNVDIKKAQMITNLSGHALDWFMKVYVAPAGTP